VLTVADDHRITSVEQGLTALASQVVRFDSKLDGIADTLRSLVRVEERQIALSEKMEAFAEDAQKIDERLRVIEVAQPGLNETRKWVVMGILAGLGMMGAALLRLVLK